MAELIFHHTCGPKHGPKKFIPSLLDEVDRGRVAQYRIEENSISRLLRSKFRAHRPRFGASGGRFRMEKLLSCPICRDPFTQAVEVQCCSKCYCLNCIEHWISGASNSGEPSSCPNCRAPLSSGQWKPNKPLQSLADDLPALCTNSSSGVRHTVSQRQRIEKKISNF